jgi:hypothetical protein
MKKIKLVIAAIVIMLILPFIAISFLASKAMRAIWDWALE